MQCKSIQYFIQNNLSHLSHQGMSQILKTKCRCTKNIINFLVIKFVLILLLFVQRAHAAATSWGQLPYIKAGSIQLVNSISDYGSSFSSVVITYSGGTFGNSSSVLQLSLTLCHFIIEQSNEISFDVNVTHVGRSNSTVIFILNQSYVISSLSFQYLVVDTQSQYLDYKSVTWTCTTLATSSGYRSQNITVPVSSFVYPDADKLQYNLYLQTISMSNFNGNFFHFQQLFSYNRSHYIVTIITSDQNLIYRVKISMILFRTNNNIFTYYYAAFYFHFKCVDIDCFKTFTPLTKNSNPDFKTQNRVVFGLKSFNFTKQGQKTYNIDLTQYSNLTINFLFSSNINFLYLEAFYIAVRSCASGKYYCPQTLVCENSCSNSTCSNTNVGASLCQGCHYSCLTCSAYGNTSCSTCNSSLNRILSGNSCLCKNGFLDIGTDICVSCSNYMLGCANCTDRFTCQPCNQGMTVNTASNPNFCSCSNPNYFISLNGSCISIDGCLSFLNQSNIIKCTQCNTSALYYEINFTCICLAGTSQVTYSDGVTKYCKIICGNGYVSIQEQCDDGNLINGDGCSSTCAIEANFACYGRLYDKSRCFQDIQLNISYIGTLRNSISNRATMYFYITPYRSALLNIVNGSQLLNTTLFQYSSNFEVSFSQSSIFSDVGQFTVNFDYFKDLQGKNYSLYLNLNQSGYFVYPTNTSYFIINQVNSKLAYNSNIDSFQSFAQIAFLVLIGFGFLIFLISLFHQKMIGVELMNTIQMYFFYLMLADSISIWLIPIQETLSYANGYNSLSSQDYFRINQLPNQLIRSGFQKEFIQNFNFMFFVLFFSIILQLLSLIIVKCCQNQTKISKKKKSYNDHQSVNILSQNFIWSRWFLCTGLIFTNQILMSFIIEISSTDQIIRNYQRVLSNAAAILSVLMILISFLFLFYYAIGNQNQSSNQQEQKTKVIDFQNTSNCYPLLFMTFQIIKILLVGLFYSYSNSVYILFSLQILYFLVYAIYRPYRQRQQYQTMIALPNKKRKDRIDINMLNFEDFKNNRNKIYCSSIHNIHNLFNSLGLILYLTLIIILKNSSTQTSTNNNNQNQETIQKVMIYLCFFHILISEILALLRLIPIKLGRLFDNIKDCLLQLQCLKKNSLQQNNLQEEQRILRYQRNRIDKGKHIPNYSAKIQTTKYRNKLIDQENKIQEQKKQIKEIDKKGKMQLYKDIKKVQKINKNNMNMNKNGMMKQQQKGWLLKQVQESQMEVKQKKIEKSSKSSKNFKRESQKKEEGQEANKKRKKVQYIIES